jgi:hypothetical protein
LGEGARSVDVISDVEILKLVGIETYRSPAAADRPPVREL